MTKLLILDLDGTVRRTKSGATFINDPNDQEIIPEALNAIASYVKRGWMVIGVTNQGGVAAGKKSLENAIAEQELTLQLLQPYVPIIYFCPDYAGEICYRSVYLDTRVCRTIEINFDNDEELIPFKGLCRKPNPGMLKLAQLECSCKVKEILYAGDRPEDWQAANNANIPFLWAVDWWMNV